MKKLLIIGLSVAAIAGPVNLGACKGCHGRQFEKKAFGMSKIVKDLNETQISEALIGYKNGTFGGPMKGVMKGQVSKYSDDQLKEIGKDISILSKK